MLSSNYTFSCSAFKLTLSKVIADKIYFFMTSLDEYLGKPKLKKHVSASGSLLSRLFSPEPFPATGLIKNLTYLLSNSSSFGGMVDCAQQNLMNFLLSG